MIHQDKSGQHQQQGPSGQHADLKRERDPINAASRAGKNAHRLGAAACILR
jgi:hypothetical protein